MHDRDGGGVVILCFNPFVYKIVPFVPFVTYNKHLNFSRTTNAPLYFIIILVSPDNKY